MRACRSSSALTPTIASHSFRLSFPLFFANYLPRSLPRPLSAHTHTHTHTHTQVERQGYDEASEGSWVVDGAGFLAAIDALAATWHLRSLSFRLLPTHFSCVTALCLHVVDPTPLLCFPFSMPATLSAVGRARACFFSWSQSSLPRAWLSCKPW